MINRPEVLELRVTLLSLTGKEIPQSVYQGIKAKYPKHRVQISVFNTSFNVDFRRDLFSESQRLRNELLSLTTQTDAGEITCFSPCDQLFYIPPTLNVLSIMGYELLSAVHKKPEIISVRRNSRTQTFELWGMLDCQQLYNVMRGVFRIRKATTITV